jgi:hypothetical protein
MQFHMRPIPSACHILPEIAARASLAQPHYLASSIVDSGIHGSTDMKQGNVTFIRSCAWNLTCGVGASASFALSNLTSILMVSLSSSFSDEKLLDRYSGKCTPINRWHALKAITDLQWWCGERKILDKMNLSTMWHGKSNEVCKWTQAIDGCACATMFQ